MNYIYSDEQLKIIQDDLRSRGVKESLSMPETVILNLICDLQEAREQLDRYTKCYDANFPGKETT